MGQKINPTGYRVGIVEPWRSLTVQPHGRTSFRAAVARSAGGHPFSSQLSRTGWFSGRCVIASAARADVQAVLRAAVVALSRDLSVT